MIKTKCYSVDGYIWHNLIENLPLTELKPDDDIYEGTVVPIETSDLLVKLDSFVEDIEYDFYDHEDENLNVHNQIKAPKEWVENVDELRQVIADWMDKKAQHNFFRVDDIFIRPLTKAEYRKIQCA